MKLLRAYISSFGKLKDFEYDFNDGYNCLLHENGWGKSTFGSFIKCMFYGLSGRGKNLEDNERQKYKPWNSTTLFGGYIEFSVKGKKFKLERYFGNKQSEDTVRLFDAETGKEFGETTNIGERIFKIDEEGYFSTTYFSEKDFEVKANTSLTARINGLSGEGESSDFDKAVARLDKKLKSYSYSGNRGIIPDLKREIYDCEEKIKRAERSVEGVNLLKGEVERLEIEVNSLKEKLTELTDAVERAGKVEAIEYKQKLYKDLKSELEKTDGEIRVNDDVLKKIPVNQERLDSISVCVKEYETNLSNLKFLESDVQKCEENKPTEKKKNSLYVLLIFASLFFVGGVVNLFFSVIAGIVLFSASLILFSVWFFGRKNTDKSICNNTYLVEKKKQYEEIKNVVDKYDDALNQIFGEFEYGNNYSEKLSYLKSAFENKKILLKQRDDLMKKLETFEKDQDLNVVIDDTITKNANSEFERIRSLYQSKTLELGNKKASYKNMIIEAENSDYYVKLSELKDKLKSTEREAEIVRKTLMFMKDADERLRKQYRKPVAESLNKYLNLISHGITAEIDVDLKVSIIENGQGRETEYYSKGYRNLYEICKRFSLIDALYTDEKPFIILDDPFNNLDEEKLQSALSLIKELSKEYQIIYLVCHESRAI